MTDSKSGNRAGGEDVRRPAGGNPETPPGEWRLKQAGGKVFGPVSSGKLGSWIREGRVAPGDQVSPAEGGGWIEIGSEPVFSGLFTAGNAGKTCPGCGRALPSDAVICTSCGTNLATGQKIGSETAAESGVKASRGRLAFEGALAGAVTGAVVLAVFLVIDVLVGRLFGGGGSFGDNFSGRLLSSAVAGFFLGIIIGIVTVMTRSAKAGTLTGLGLLGIGLLLVFIASPLAGFLMLIGAVFWGFMVYLASSAIAQSVMHNIRWEKYD